MKVSELSDEKLDYWAAIADELEAEITPPPVSYCIANRYYYSPSTNWSQGGAIIEREGIKLKDGIFEKWKADLKCPYYKFSMEGPTALVAAMRAFVASRFGLEVHDS